jgi:tetratricopeptide (TPR) repeat protein
LLQSAIYLAIQTISCEKGQPQSRFLTHSYAYLHTLACLNGARGETAEARQLLLEAMSSGHLEEPNGAIWYWFGRIYEQYGLYDAAANAYKRVERPDGVIDPRDSFMLA